MLWRLHRSYGCAQAFKMLLLRDFYSSTKTRTLLINEYTFHRISKESPIALLRRGKRNTVASWRATNKMLYYHISRVYAYFRRLFI